MQASPIRIDAYFLKEINFSVLDKLEILSFEQKEFDGLDFTIKDVTTPTDSNNQNWRSEVIVEAKPGKGATVPYAFKVTMVGFFTVDPEYPEERRKLIVETNAPAILYSSIREIVFNMTSKNPFPTMLLPSVTFLKPPEEVGEVKGGKKSTTKKKSVSKKDK